MLARPTSARRPPRLAASSHKRTRRLLTLGVLALIAGYVGIAAAIGLEALADARTGRSLLLEAQAAARRQDADATRGAAVKAGSSFAQAEGRIRSSILAPLRLVPVASSHVRVADAMARAGTLSARAALHVADAIETRPAGGWAIRGGAIDLEAVSAAVVPLRRSLAAVSEAKSIVESSPSRWLVGPVARVRRDAVAQVDRAERVAAGGALGSDLVVGLLGGREHRRYYVAVSNLSELRGTGGLIGLFGALDATGGKLSFRSRGRPTDLLPPPTARTLDAPKWYVRAYARHGGTRIWQSINVSTDFPTVGRLITRALAQPGSLGPVDGVVQVDPIAVQALLSLTGPVSVPPWPEPIDSMNVSSVTQHDAYLRFAGQGAGRFDFLGRVAEAVFQRVAVGGLSLDERALETLGDAAAGGHIQVYATRPEEERALASLGLARGVDRADDATDVLGVTTENWSPSKADWFLRRRVDYEVTLVPSEVRPVRGRLRVELHNGAPRGGLPTSVIGTNAAEVAYAHNRQLALLLRAPGDELVGDVSVDGVPQPVSADFERRLRSYSRFVTVPPGGGSVVEAAFEVGEGLRGSGRSRTYRLHVLRQPVAHPDEYSIRIAAPRGWTVDGRTTFRGPLERDLVLEVRLHHTLRAWAFEAAVLRPLRLARDLLGRVF